MGEPPAPGFRLSPAAQADLDSIFDHTAGQWGLEQAEDYTAIIVAACEALARAPRQAQDCGGVRAGYRRGSAGRHHVYFRIEDYGIAVIRILHQRMDAFRHL